MVHKHCNAARCIKITMPLQKLFHPTSLCLKNIPKTRQQSTYVSDGNSVYNSAMISPKLPSFLIVLCKRTLGNDDFDHTAAVCAAAYILGKAQKSLYISPTLSCF